MKIVKIGHQSNYIVYVLLCIFLIVCGCSNISPKIEKAKFRYLPNDLESWFSFSLYDVMGEEMSIDTMILDRCDLDSLQIYLNQLKPSDSNDGYDLRIVSNIIYADGHVDTLCMGDLQTIVLNGVLMENDKNMMNFVYRMLYTDIAERKWRRFDPQYWLDSIANSKKGVDGNQ